MLHWFLHVSKQKRDEEVKEFLKKNWKINTKGEREKFIYDLVWFDENIFTPAKPREFFVLQ